MEDFYSAEEKLLREQATKFILEKVRPRVEEWEKTGEMPKSIFKEFAAQGFLGILVPEEYGGSNAGPKAFLAFSDAFELSTSAGVGAAIAMHAGIVTRLVAELASDPIKKKIIPPSVKGDIVGALGLTEPNAGSDLASLTTNVRREGDYYVLNGTKTFITNGCWCDYVLVLCRQEGTKGYEGMNLLLVERNSPGFSVSRRIETLGWRPSQTGELVFENVRVPAGNILGKEGKGFQQIMRALEWERLMMAHQSLRKAEIALDMTMKFVAEREQFGKPIAAFQNTRHVIAECATRIEVGRALVKEAVKRHLAHEESEAFAASAKLLCCEDAQWILDRCLQLHGGYGYTMEFPIQRLWRDHRLFTIGGGTSEVQREILARILDR
ncbi:MAG: acyl-CoA dehydrogenase family protein [Bdellovibrionota bacterium]